MSYRARRANFSLVSLQNPKPIYMKLGWVSCLALIDRVTLADRTTFPHIMNTLVCLTGPILGKKTVTSTK